jgi:hypothetical protein
MFKDFEMVWIGLVDSPILVKVIGKQTDKGRKSKINVLIFSDLPHFQ